MDGCRLLFTDTDSLSYGCQTDNIVADMVASERDRSIAAFDITKTLTSTELERMTNNNLKKVIQRIQARFKLNKGMCGTMAFESGDWHIRAFIGMVAKRYSMELVDERGLIKQDKKGKDNKMCIMQKNTLHAEYKAMRLKPCLSEASLCMLSPEAHEMQKRHLAKNKLTARNVKVCQMSPLESMPLGHYRHNSEM